MPQSNPMSTNTEHLDRIAIAISYSVGGHRERAEKSLTALRASIAEMDRAISHGNELLINASAQIAALTVERDQAREALEAAEEIGFGAAQRIASLTAELEQRKK